MKRSVVCQGRRGSWSISKGVAIGAPYLVAPLRCSGGEYFPQLGVPAKSGHRLASLRQSPQKGSIGIASIDRIDKKGLFSSGQGIQLPSPVRQMFQSHHAETVFFAHFLDGGFLFRGGVARDFWRGSMGELNWDRPPGTLGSAGLEQQTALNKALTFDQVDFEGRAQRVARVRDSGKLFARVLLKRVT